TTLGNKTAYTKDNLILQYGLKETSPKTEGIENDHVNDIHNPFSEEIPEESIDVSFVPDYDAVIEKPKDIIPDSLTGKATKAGSSLIFKMPEYDVPKSKPKPLKFHISRYTKFGRRRSDLELIFLAAIRIIAYVKDWFADLAHPEKNPKNIPYIKKIETLQRAMHTANANNITSVEELQLALKECGIELSNQKAIKNDIEKNKDYLEDMVQTIDRLDALRTLHPEIDAGNGTLADMNIRLPDEKEVQKNKALLQPLTPKLRRSLFSLLKEHPELSLKFGWNEMSERLSLSQGRLLNEYLRSLADNPSSPIPESLSDVLETYDEHRKNSKVYFYENLRIKKDKSIKDKYSSLPLNADMFKKLKSLCDEKGLTVNLRSLSMYEGMQILGHYSENELDKPLIDKDQKDILQKAVKDGSITLSRKIDYVTKDEYEAIIRHLKNPKNYCPEVLKSSPPIRPSEAKQIEELLKVKGEKISIPVMELSQEDGDRLFDYLLNKGTTPDIVARIEQEKEDILFENKLASYPEEQRAAFVEYRSLLKKMTDLGVSPSDRRLLTQQLDQMSKALASTQAKVNDLSLKYRSLNNVGKCLVYANDLSFTHGVDFEKGHNKRCEVEFINERSETDRDIFNKEIEQEEIIEGQLKDLSDLSPNDWDGIPETLLNIEQIRQLNMSYISFGVAEANERQKIARLNKEAVKKQEHENEQQPEQERQSHQRKTASPDLGY
ncbi:MAG: hypothetical protein IJS80_07440, partial [Lachnospiraceae bacterium]|nr:hypothetical protein [Lachnospiraceae bacterium]